MIDTGNEVHLGPIDMRKKIVLWTLEPPTIIRKKGGFSGGPMAKTPQCQCRGSRFHPWSGTRSQTLQLKILHAARRLQIPRVATKSRHCQINKYIFKDQAKEWNKCSIKEDHQVANEHKEKGFKS